MFFLSFSLIHQSFIFLSSSSWERSSLYFTAENCLTPKNLESTQTNLLCFRHLAYILSVHLTPLKTKRLPDFEIQYLPYPDDKSKNNESGSHHSLTCLDVETFTNLFSIRFIDDLLQLFTENRIFFFPLLEIIL